MMAAKKLDKKEYRIGKGKFVSLFSAFELPFNNEFEPKFFITAQSKGENPKMNSRSKGFK